MHVEVEIEEAGWSTIGVSHLEVPVPMPVPMPVPVPIAMPILLPVLVLEA